MSPVKIMTTEPVVAIGTLAGALAAVISLLQAFGLTHWSDAQLLALAGIGTAIGPVVLALIQRRFVTPTPQS
jgi:hypothetical protein